MFIAANWKMNLNKKKIQEFITDLENFEFDNGVKACIFPSFIFIDYLYSLISDKSISLGSQNCHFEKNGSFTGDISPYSLKEYGCEYVILGHSERRAQYNEDNNFIKKCAYSAIDAGLKPIICVGESIEIRNSGNAINFIKSQLDECLPENCKDIYIAYEPMWSIGTGIIPNINQIEEIHSIIKIQAIKKNIDTTKVLYGGSVKPDNAEKIMSIDNVDGTLIGGASLNVKDFLAIYCSAVKQIKVIS